MQDLKISLIQSDIHWQAIEANLAMFEEKIWQIPGATDVILLPEMFSTGFTMDAARLAEPMHSKTFRWMRQMAAQTSAVVAGSYIVREGLQFFNRLIWMQPDGQYAYYDKRHLFRMAKEETVYTPGNKKLLVEWKGWKICPLICYDLRFPVWSRNRAHDDGQCDYDLLLFVANWPAARTSAWENLLKSRAIENLAFVAGLNRVGTDGDGIAYSGQSATIDPKGLIVDEVLEKDTIITSTLNYEELHAFRQKFPAYLDADEFDIRQKQE